LSSGGKTLFLFSLLPTVSVWMVVDSLAPMDYPNDGFFVHSAIPLRFFARSSSYPSACMLLPCEKCGGRDSNADFTSKKMHSAKCFSSAREQMVEPHSGSRP
jgi:hypothetical protein